MESMTGFARVSHPLKKSQGNVHIQIKSVNHRGLEFKFWLPGELAFLEFEFRQILQKYFTRGYFEIRMTLSHKAVDGQRWQFVQQNFEAYLNVLKKLKLPVNEQTLFLWALNMPGVWQMAPSLSPDWYEDHQDFVKSFHKACQLLKTARLQEGRYLKSLIQKGLKTLESYRRQILKKWQALPKDSQAASRYWQPVWEAWQSFQQGKFRSSEAQPLDETKAWLAWWEKLEKHCIQEELDRLKSHHGVLQNLVKNSSPEVGRQLDFYLTECLREWNTLSQKALLPEWTHLALEAKAWVEKLRQQVQNIQ